MNVKIGALEITNVSHDDLELLIKRFGRLSPTAMLPKSSSSVSGSGNEHSNHGSGTQTADVVALRRLVEAGNDGVKTNDIGEILGRRGKAARGAVREWSKRIGLTKEGDTMDTFEDCRVGTSRGVRIRPNLLEVAKMLTKNHQ